MFGITPSRVLAAIFIVSATESAKEHTGDAFWFHPGYGACGFVNADTDLVASVSSTLFHTYQWAKSSHSPSLTYGKYFRDGSGKPSSICDHRLVATVNGKTVYAHIVDDFTDPHRSEYDLGFSPAAFEVLGGKGTIRGVKWHVEEY
ncbi:hypothetical protein C8J57DRAFT_1508027 [Mycena rebaudengoi]|nr:hypothetical protein C8J57DRAFT_1508027 [Mycena rebaudengoi]